MTTYADDTANMFALQAGNIAGAAEECGQDVTMLSARSKEVINVLTPISSEQTTADAIFDKAEADALAKQSSIMRKISCSDVLTTYNSLPLLRSDYKQSVIAVLAAHRNVPPTPPAVPAQQLVTTQTQPEASMTSQVPVSQSDPAQPQSQIQSALSNEMPINGNGVQSYVSADNNAANSAIPSTVMPSSDVITVTQAFNQSNLSPSLNIQQNAITNNQ